MRKVDRAAGVKLSTVTPVINTVNTAQNPLSATPVHDPKLGPAPSKRKPGFSPSGWSWSAVDGSSSGGSFKKAGRTTVARPQKPPSPPPPPPPSGLSYDVPIPPLPTTSVSGFGFKVGLDHTRRSSIRLHSEQTVDTQCLPSVITSRTYSYSKPTPTLDDRIQSYPRQEALGTRGPLPSEDMLITLESLASWDSNVPTGDILIAFKMYSIMGSPCYC